MLHHHSLQRLGANVLIDLCRLAFHFSCDVCWMVMYCTLAVCSQCVEMSCEYLLRRGFVILLQSFSFSCNWCATSCDATVEDMRLPKYFYEFHCETSCDIKSALGTKVTLGMYVTSSLSSCDFIWCRTRLHVTSTFRLRLFFVCVFVRFHVTLREYGWINTLNFQFSCVVHQKSRRILIQKSMRLLMRLRVS